jgi:hypothetical protein
MINDFSVEIGLSANLLGIHLIVSTSARVVRHIAQWFPAWLARAVTRG